MDMSTGDSSSTGPLTSAGVDFSNETQAFDFLQEVLDDSTLGVVGNQYARYFWYGVVVVIGIATICNVTQRAVLRMRIRASAANRARPAKPSNLLTQSFATATAIIRESSYLQMTPVGASKWVRVPPLGSIYIIVAYFAFILTLVFANNNVAGAQHYQALSIRAGWLGAAQVPLLVLLSSKMNLIGFLCNASVERLNVYHRWVARGLLLLASLHFGLQSHGWNIYNLMVLEWQTDLCPPTGMAAFAALLWMNLTTLAPLRFFSYKFFVVQHLLTYFCFTIAIVYHLYGTTAPYATNYIYISIALFLVGQSVRWIRGVIVNIRSSKALLTPLEGGDATKIRVSTQQIKRWGPGSYVRLFIPQFNVFQGHPATILSTPTSHDGDLVFVLRSRGGFTRQIMKTATQAEKDVQPSFLTLIDGPYPGAHADFACFDSLVLIAGSTGVTFTLSNLLDIAERARSQRPLPLRTVYFTWVIKRRNWIKWVAEELHLAFNALQEAGIETHFNVYITCDDATATGDVSHKIRKNKSEGCQCEGDCACCQPESRDDAESIAPVDLTGEKTAQVSMPSNGGDSYSDADIPFAIVHSRRPAFDNLFRDVVCQAQGESAVAVCGPLSLSVAVRTAVVRISDQLAVDKGSGLGGLYLHVESFT